MQATNSNCPISSSATHIPLKGAHPQKNPTQQISNRKVKKDPDLDQVCGNDSSQNQANPKEKEA